MYMLTSSLVSLYTLISITCCAKDREPNIIVIIWDDVGYVEIGYNGGNIPTPNIDRLALNGIRLNYNYVEPSCSPTRSSLLTGLYSYKTGLNDVIAVPNAAATDDSLKFISNSLSENNWNTLFIGKWHIGGTTQSQLPISRGFQQSLYFKNGFINYYDHNICFNWGLVAFDGLVSGELEGSFIPQLFETSPAGYCGYDLWTDLDDIYLPNDDGSYIEDILFNRILTFLDEYNSKNPFFIWYATATVHTPLSEPPQTSPICNAMGDSNSERVKTCNAIYYADKKIGNLISKLKDLKLYKETVIIFLSDNGGQPLFPILDGGGGNSLPLRGCKGSPFEAGIRTAAMISGGYIKNEYRNCDYNNIVYATDYYPIISAFANINNKMDTNLDTIDGINLLPNIYSVCKKKSSSSSSSSSLSSSSSDKRRLYEKGVNREQFVAFRYDKSIDRFERAIIRNNEYKLVINPFLYQFPSPFFEQFLFIQWYVPFDTNFTILPNEESYTLYNAFDAANNNNDIYKSKCYEDGNLINTSPYIDENIYPQMKIYLFDLQNDNIEACNIANHNLDIVDELINILLSELPNYNGGGGKVTTTPDSKGAILSGIDAYDCNQRETSYVTWADKQEYQNINQDWTMIFQSYIDRVEDCDSYSAGSVISSEIQNKPTIYSIQFHVDESFSYVCFGALLVVLIINVSLYWYFVRNQQSYTVAT